MPVLTEITLRNLKPPERGQKTYTDDSLTGFGVRVSQGGTKTFTLVYGVNRQRVTIGRYPVITLNDQDHPGGHGASRLCPPCALAES